ncbi:MAG: hypothetical protein JW815_06375 [Candidatus Bathyarchaeota archaeon]|nr:hypothetical protein [Candidatus Bathyarchaeum sp.]
MKPSQKLMAQLNKDERILWYGRPLRTPFLMGVAEFIIIEIIVISLLIYLAWTYGHIANIIALFFGIICTLLFLVYAPYRLLKAARETEYMVTEQRVFFETMSEYAFENTYKMMMGENIGTVKVVDLKDVEDVYMRRGFHDKIFGTSTVYVHFKGFQRTTKHWGAEGEVILRHKPPSFAFINEADRIKKIIQEAAEKVYSK